MALIFMYRCFCGDVKNEHFLLPTEILLEIGLMANTFLYCTCPSVPFTHTQDPFGDSFLQCCLGCLQHLQHFTGKNNFLAEKRSRVCTGPG